MAVTFDTFRNDLQGTRMADVLIHPDFGPALQAALDVLNAPVNRKLMVRDVDLYGVPPLAPLVAEIESAPGFSRAARKHGKAGVGRLKQAIGIATKFAMQEEGFEPAFTANDLQDQGRLDDCLAVAPQVFSTARRYRRVGESRSTPGRATAARRAV